MRVLHFITIIFISCTCFVYAGPEKEWKEKEDGIEHINKVYVNNSRSKLSVSKKAIVITHNTIIKKKKLCHTRIVTTNNTPTYIRYRQIII